MPQDIPAMYADQQQEHGKLQGPVAGLRRRMLEVTAAAFARTF
jgi:hypothetical protein